MADISFSNKSGSSNFTASGDKNNEIFGDLLLNRTELETYLTSLRRQQYSANPPANPNTGDMWRCSTTGATYTAGVLYRYSGTAWVQEIATALNVPNRNTVLQGAVNSSGVPTLFEAGTGLACKLNATATPAIFAFMNGNSASTGAQDIIDGIAADNATFWSSLPINSTVYLFVDRSSAGVLSGSYTTIAPVTQNYAPAHSAGLQWVDFNTGKVQSSDGSAWTQRNRAFVGTATTDGSGVTAVSVYRYNVDTAVDAAMLGLLSVASLPAHYERSAKWSNAGSDTATNRRTLLGPARLTVNINDAGFVLDAATSLDLNTAANWDSTTYATAANRAGKNFYIYACAPGSGSVPVILLSAKSTVPTGYSATTSRKIGGFHCLCLSAGTISGNPASGYLTGDIIPNSVWDLKFKPSCSPEGMAYIDRLNLWVDIYLQSGTGTSTAAVHGATITDTRMWNDHVDDLGAVGKRLLDDSEFQIAAEGSNQCTNIAGSADPNTTGGHVDTAGRRMISNYFLEDCCGALWQWLRDQSYQPGTGVAGFKDVVGTTRGQIYLVADNADVKLLAGGGWAYGAVCGSRARVADSYRWSAFAVFAGRGRAEPA